MSWHCYIGDQWPWPHRSRHNESLCGHLVHWSLMDGNMGKLTNHLYSHTKVPLQHFYTNIPVISPGTFSSQKSLFYLCAHDEVTLQMDDTWHRGWVSVWLVTNVSEVGPGWWQCWQEPVLCSCRRHTWTEASQSQCPVTRHCHSRNCYQSWTYPVSSCTVRVMSVRQISSCHPCHRDEIHVQSDTCHVTHFVSTDQHPLTRTAVSPGAHHN